ncbi:MAG: hypothetical protein EB168_02365 [Euryarchaeota archaeon]|nr:hypothetical protein [Euryarchaeota archaeon]
MINQVSEEGVGGLFSDRAKEAFKAAALGGTMGATAGIPGGPLGMLIGTLISGGGAFLGNFFGSDSDQGFFKAEGGPVRSGRPYIVGEQGPELFIPRSSGQILPNMSGPSMNTPTAMLSTTGMLGTATQTAAANTATASRDDSNKLMAEQNDKLDELITVVKQSKNIHSKMLSASYS